jgi:hypothetical protein
MRSQHLARHDSEQLLSGDDAAIGGEQFINEHISML